MLPGLVLHLDSSPFQVRRFVPIKVPGRFFLFPSPRYDSSLFQVPVLPMARKTFHQQHFRPFLLPVASFLRHRQHREFSRCHVTPSGGLFRIHQPGGFLITDPYDTGQLVRVGRETESQLPEDFRFLGVPKFSE